VFLSRRAKSATGSAWRVALIESDSPNESDSPKAERRAETPLRRFIWIVFIDVFKLSVGGGPLEAVPIRID
jgi:hypothetical protein